MWAIESLTGSEVDGETVADDSTKAQPWSGDRSNLFEKALTELAGRIRSGEFPYGSRLPAERDLSEDMGVSRTTLRTVVRSLQQAGFIRTERGRSGGSFVIWHDSESTTPGGRMSGALRERLLDEMTFRSVLEPGAAALAAERDLSDGEIEALRERLKAARSSAAGFRIADSELHAYIAHLSGCHALEQGIGDVQLLLNQTLLQVVPMMGTALEHSHQQHDEIVAAILSKRPDLARSLMQKHVTATTELIRGFLV